MKFSEFHAGQVIETGSRTITEQEILDFAAQWDPQWFHLDIEAAQTGPYGGLIASGWHTCVITMRLMAESVLKDSGSFGSPGLQNVKWIKPVRPNDTLRAVCTILDTRQAASRPMGIVRWIWQVYNQHQEEVMSMESAAMFKLD